jgi:hypothetical protein
MSRIRLRALAERRPGGPRSGALARLDAPHDDEAERRDASSMTVRSPAWSTRARGTPWAGESLETRCIDTPEECRARYRRLIDARELL